MKGASIKFENSINPQEKSRLSETKSQRLLRKAARAIITGVDTKETQVTSCN